MKKDMDTIQFESRAELGELLNMIEKYVKAFPKEKENQTLKKFYYLIYAMEMEW